MSLSEIDQTVTINHRPVRVQIIYCALYRGLQQVIGTGGGKRYQWIEWCDGKRSKAFNLTDGTFEGVQS